MKKYLLDKDSEEQVINRVLKLNSISENCWGNMTVNEMLFHCRKVNNEILQAKQQNKTPTIRQKIMKTIGLYVMNEFPKGIKTGPKYLPERIDNMDFQKVQNELIDSIKEISNYKNEIYGEHPFFGALNTNEWRRFIWKHMDHHLRQFKV